MSRLAEGKPADFAAPIAAPETTQQHAAWQAANRVWWETHPMRYDWKKPLRIAAGERAWYEEIDHRFFAAGVIPHEQLPFDSLIPFEHLKEMNVLEIGVGMGSHAQLLAQYAGRFTGIDLTRAAVEATRQRFALFGLRGQVLQINAEALAFPDRTFDLIWSWGVIHHAADTRAVLGEMRRVLKPRGRALVMVYHRAWVPWHLYTGLVRGVLLGGFLRRGNIHSLLQSVTDGALARFYTRREWRRELRGLFEVERFSVFGNRAEVLPLPAGWLKEALLRRAPERVLRFWLTTCRQGLLLFSHLRPV